MNEVVLFTAPAVERHHLLEGRETRSAKTMGAGGMSDARIGRIGFIELAGRRFDDQVAVFSPPQRGALGDPHIARVLGNTLVSPFKVVLNYPLGKIAFLDRSAMTDDAPRIAAAAEATPARL